MQDTPPITWTWPLPGGGRSNDDAALRARWAAVHARGGWTVQRLGHAGDDAIEFWQRRAARPGAPALLIAAGFHGEEPAGPWGLLQFIESAPAALLDAADLALLPLVNASGFRAGRRFNDWGENPNRGFSPNPDVKPSREGRVLLAHGERLVALGRDGVLSCHEDVKQTRFGYLYSLERSERPGPFSLVLRDANARHFPLHPDGEVDGSPISEGIAFNRYDGSFEAWLMESGVARAAVVETPGQADISARIAAQAAVAESFVRYFAGA